MINLSLNELKLIAKSRSVKDYKNKSREYLIKILGKSKSKISLFKKKIEDIKNDFSKLRHSLRHGFSKLKTSEFIWSLYNLEIQKYLPAPKIKETKKNLLEFEKSPPKVLWLWWYWTPRKKRHKKFIWWSWWRLS